MPVASESTAIASVTTTMTTFPASASSPPKPLPTTQTALAASFTNFLTVTIHQILYLRSVYPRATFLPVRAYNYPVRQSRHPKVCDYINDASMAVGTEILKGTITAVSIILSSLRTNQPLERYAFDLSAFPRVPPGEVNTTFEDRKDDSAKPTDGFSTSQAVDLEAQFRACLARLASACARLTPLPRDDEVSFTVCIEVREDALPPAGTSQEEQTWIVAEPGEVHLRSCTAPYSVSTSRYGDPQQLQQIRASPRMASGRPKTVPVRRVEAGELRLEMWVEEAQQKFKEPAGG